MKYHITVCDDQEAIREKVVRTLRSLEKESGKELEITQFSSAEQLLFEYSDRTDLLILDIQMEDMTGMEAAKELRRRGKNVEIIFLTALMEYAVEGYDVHAYGYLLKPVDEKVLKEKVNAVLEKLSVKESVNIEFKNKDGIDIIDAYSILYLESFSHYLDVHTAEGTKSYLMRMRDIEETLCEHDFFRIHKSYLINLRKVKKIAGEDVVLEGNVRLPVSRNRRKEFLIAFTEFMK